MNKYLITFDSDRLGYSNFELHYPVGCGILPGITAVYGKNGSGKSMFGTILEKGKYAFGNRLSFSSESLKVKMLAFTDIHSLSGMEVSYYHQRMEATMNDYVPTVEEIMNKKEVSTTWEQKCVEIGLSDVAKKRINYLSSGELRKLLLVNALEVRPDILILDNPYIGLDADSRIEFNSSPNTLRTQGISVILLVSDPDDIPDFTDNLMHISDRYISMPITDRKEILHLKNQEINTAESDTIALEDLPATSSTQPDYSIAFAIRNGKVAYGEKTILENINWEVRAGECWSLEGKNGSGKSLLLSMVCADNPQGYANDITLFDRRRGSGESIFEIKDNIGFVSPEMQLYFKSADPVKEIIVQGKRNSLNRFRPTKAEERAEADKWLRILGIEHLSECKFHNLSSGEQRLVLLARAFIKQPALLVLDEPFHGLDRMRKNRLKNIISFLVERNHSSLIFVSHYKEEIPSCVSKTLSLSSASTSENT